MAKFKIYIAGSVGGGTPTKTRNLPSYLLNDKILLDGGDGFTYQLRKGGKNLSKIETIFISHEHPDHWAGIIGYLQAVGLNKRPQPLKIIGPEEVLNFLTASMKFMENSINLEFIPLKEDGLIYTNKGLTITALKVPHTDNSYGFLIKQEGERKFDGKKAAQLGVKGPMFGELKKNGFVETEQGVVKIDDVSTLEPGTAIFYTGDVGPEVFRDSKLLTNLKSQVDALNLLLVDGTYLKAKDRKNQSHLTLEEAVKLAEELEAINVVLTHISNRYNDNDVEEANVVLRAFADEKGLNMAAVAEDGMTVEI